MILVSHIYSHVCMRAWAELERAVTTGFPLNKTVAPAPCLWLLNRKGNGCPCFELCTRSVLLENSPLKTFFSTLDLRGSFMYYSVSIWHMQTSSLLETGVKCFEMQINLAKLTSVVHLARCCAILITNNNLQPFNRGNADRSSNPETFECETNWTSQWQQDYLSCYLSI